MSGFDDFMIDEVVGKNRRINELEEKVSDLTKQLRARDEQIAGLRAKAAELMACFNAMKKCYEESDADCAALLVRIEGLKNEMS